MSDTHDFETASVSAPRLAVARRKPSSHVTACHHGANRRDCTPHCPCRTKVDRAPQATADIKPQRCRPKRMNGGDTSGGRRC